MVSTRGLKIKFNEGERVLCYEPDPTKAKVLYDSKVLRVIHSKDPKGRKQLEYLIHFQGWNASWDRIVPDDFVLKDIIENRDLQQELADKSQIKLSIKSNRVLLGSGSSSHDRKRRRRLSETIRETIERERNLNKSESDTSSQPCTTDDDLVSASSDVESSSSCGNDTEGVCPEVEMRDEESCEEEIINKTIPVVIPDALKDVIEKDFFLINEKNKLVNLPSTKSIITILEDYVRFFALRYIATYKGRRKSDAREKDKNFMTLDLCKEVVDGLRICFDFYVDSLLLYPRERQQAEKLKKAAPFAPEIPKLPVETKPKEIVKEKKEEPQIAPRRILRSKRSLPEELVPPTELKEASKALASCESGHSTPSTLVSGTTGLGTENFPISVEDLAKLPKYRGLAHQLKNWTILPDNFRNPPPPVLLYGSIHLLRLFVKLPEILYKMNVTVERRKIILYHVDLLLDYLNLNIENLFSDSNYINYQDLI